MGTLYVLMGKSTAGKDSLYRRLKEDSDIALIPVIPYTTRPRREGEEEGVQYHFRTDAEYEAMREEGRILEERTYETCAGPWHYFTADDGQIDLSRGDYLMIGTIAAYTALRDHFGGGVVPLYIECSDRVRMERAMRREARQEVPRYDELCRRYLADEADYSDEALLAAGITERFANDDAIENTLEALKTYIHGH